MKRVVLVTLLLAIISFGRPKTKSTIGAKGAMAIGGSISMTSIDENNEGDNRNYNVSINPAFTWYPADRIPVKGVFHFNAQEGSSFFGMGATGGYVFSLDLPVYPFIEGGLEFIHSMWWNNSELGLAIPIQGGIMIPLAKNVTLDVGLKIYTKFIAGNPGSDLGLYSGFAFWL